MRAHACLMWRNTREVEGELKMADNMIPGLDGDLPPDRGHLPDSLQVKPSNGETVGYSGQQARPGQPADPTSTHPKVRNSRDVWESFQEPFRTRP